MTNHDPNPNPEIAPRKKPPYKCRPPMITKQPYPPSKYRKTQHSRRDSSPPHTRPIVPHHRNAATAAFEGGGGGRKSPQTRRQLNTQPPPAAADLPCHRHQNHVLSPAQPSLGMGKKKKRICIIPVTDHFPHPAASEMRSSIIPSRLRRN